MSLENYSDWCQDNTSFGSFSGDEQDRLVAFWVEGVMVPMVGGIGVCGNICSIIVLSKSEFRETFHRLLICLSVVDSAFIICAVFTFLVRSQGLLDGPLVSLLTPLFLLSLPMGSFALVTSMYLTISISVERYFGICFPIQSRVQRRRRLCVYLVPVIIFSIIFNIPKFLEITPGGELNWSLSNNLLYNKIYRQYTELLVTVVIPLLALLCLNCRIFHAVTNKEIRGSGSIARQKKENNLAIILVAIVMVFFCCHSLKFFLSFYKVHVTSKTVYCSTLGLSPYYPKWMHTMSYINHLMLVLNSSINFIIYCFVGTRFRRSLLRSLFSLIKHLNVMNTQPKMSSSSEASRSTQMTFISRTPSPGARSVHIHASLTNKHRKVKRSEYRMVRKVEDGDDLLTVTDKKVEGAKHVDQE